MEMNECDYVVVQNKKFVGIMKFLDAYKLLELHPDDDFDLTPVNYRIEDLEYQFKD